MPGRSVMGRICSTALDDTQKASLDSMVGKGMLAWPTVEEPADIRGLDRDVKVAVMTYAADMYSWYAGSVDADVYFCPERHGTYFGSFYLKDSPAMGNSAYAIPTDMTGNMGEALLAALTSDQAAADHRSGGHPEALSAGDRGDPPRSLRRTAQVPGGRRRRQAVAGLDGAIRPSWTARSSTIALSHFAGTEQITDAANNRPQLAALRTQMLGDLLHPDGAYPVLAAGTDMPEIPDTDFLFQ